MIPQQSCQDISPKDIRNADAMQAHHWVISLVASYMDAIFRIIQMLCAISCNPLPELGHTRHILDILKLLAHLDD